MKEGFEAKLLNVDINKDMKHNTPNNINFKRGYRFKSKSYGFTSIFFLRRQMGSNLRVRMINL